MSANKDEYNRGGLLAFTFSMVFIISFIFYLVVIHPGVNLGENVVDPHAPKSEGSEKVFNIDEIQEPWVSTDSIVAYGKKVYETNCSMCHGPTGKGDGPAGGALNPPPRNLVAGKWTQGDGVINHFKALSNGIKGTSMAGYSHFKSADRWALVNFIESITQNKSKDDANKVAEFAKTAK